MQGTVDQIVTLTVHGSRAAPVYTSLAVQLTTVADAAGLRSAQGAAGYGFGFTWPAKFPMARIDHIMVRGVVPTKAWVMAPTGSDHRPVVAEIRI